MPHIYFRANILVKVWISSIKVPPGFEPCGLNGGFFMSQSNPLATERIGNLLPRYAIPSIISLLISSLYNIVDQIFIGHGVGYLGNCATSITFPLTVIGLAIAQLIGDGTAAHLSLCQGKNNTERFDLCLGNGLTMGTVLSVLYMVIFFLFSEEILTAFGATSETLSLTEEYSTVIFIGMPFYVVSNLLSAVIRADGSPQYCLLAMSAGAVFNIVFDPIFIFALDMGVLGAAIATIVGQIISCVITVAYLWKSKTFRLCKNSFRFCPKETARALPLGISSFLTQFAIVVVSGVSNMLLVKYGAVSVYGSDIPVAVQGIVMKVFAIVISIALGLAIGAQPIIGFNYASQNYQRVKSTFKLVVGLTFLVSIIATVLFEIFPNLILRIFGDEGPVYMEYGLLSFRIYLSLIGFTCIQKVSSIFLQAIGKPVSSILVSISRDMVFQLFFMIVLSAFFGIIGVLYAGPAADILALFTSIVFISFEWRKMSKAAKSSDFQN